MNLLYLLELLINIFMLYFRYITQESCPSFFTVCLLLSCFLGHFFCTTQMSQSISGLQPYLILLKVFFLINTDAFFDDFFVANL